ncbi:MAG: 3-deoxy-D-manno-octulosonic acid transferase [Planctomycetes bacterium]|nr:3-deoxy-D-manno-octulosonic acid transferase [Planctomycetota bacterium]
MTLLYDLIYLLAAALLGIPYAIVRRIRRGPGSLALAERLGKPPSRPVSAHCVWIHGVSLGEINATRTIVADLHRRSPDTTIVISSTTATGLARAREIYPKLVVFRFPLDFSLILHRALNHIRPSIIVLMELEVWPNLVEVARRQDVPVIIANGRVTSERSMKYFGLPVVRTLTRRMFRQIRWVAAQDETYADRFRKLGVPADRVEVCGSVKYDTAEVAERVDGQEVLADAMTINLHRPLLTCGSTGPGEEAILLDAYARLRGRHPDLQLAFVPRKPERFDEVAELVASRGFACLRRSGKPPIVPPGVPEPRAVFLGDTMGELRKFYGLASIVFVGRSLVPMGGSDVMEAAGLGKPLLVGPDMGNFAEAAGLLATAGASICVRDAEEFAEAADRLLRDTAARQKMGDAARATIVSQRGATERTVNAILRLGQIG